MKCIIFFSRTTFLRFISQYCQKGDIEGATSVIKIMAERDLPLNEAIFNALITGHAQARLEIKKENKSSSVI